MLGLESWNSYVNPPPKAWLRQENYHFFQIHTTVGHVVDITAIGTKVTFKCRREA